MISQSLIPLRQYLSVISFIVLLMVPLSSCSNHEQSILSTSSPTNMETNVSSKHLNIPIEDSIEQSILQGTIKEHPAGKKLLTQKQKFKQMIMRCAEDKENVTGFGGQMYGPYELSGGKYIFAFNCAAYITGPELRLFVMDSDGIISTVPLELETVEPKGRGDYETKFSSRVSGFPEFNLKEQTLSFRKYCRKTAGQRDSLSIYKIADGTLQLKELWLDKQEQCFGKSDLERVF
jgi:hypothetical protein